tara:strand:- start:125 stop:322 length:198 start_codon:yes stop_codon:yes gene_type:complete
MNKRTHQYRNLISALNAALVIVDYQEDVASSSGASKDGELAGVIELLKAASAFAVPVSDPPAASS